MRLDKYLKTARLIKRRTVANEACDTQRVSVNGREAKASYQVKVGNIIEIATGSRSLKLNVPSVPEHVSKQEASLLYSEITE